MVPPVWRCQMPGLALEPLLAVSVLLASPGFRENTARDQSASRPQVVPLCCRIARWTGGSGKASGFAVSLISGSQTSRDVLCPCLLEIPCVWRAELCARRLGEYSPPPNSQCVQKKRLLPLSTGRTNAIGRCAD